MIPIIITTGSLVFFLFSLFMFIVVVSLLSTRIELYFYAAFMITFILCLSTFFFGLTSAGISTP